MLRLASGRDIQLDELDQSLVYGGLLEGLPTRAMNARTIRHVIAQQRKRWRHGPYLIEPVQTPIAYEGRYPFGTPASLPAIQCIARFHSTAKLPPTPDDVLYFTALTVIWYQDDYAFPISADARAAIEALDWDTLSDQQEK